VLALSLGALSGIAQAEGWDDSDAARTTSGNLDDYLATSKNPDDLTVESHDPGEMRVGSESLENHEAHAENPASLLTGAGSIDQQEATSENLTDLREARPDPGFDSIEVPGQADWRPTADAQVILARDKLVHAQKRARAARTEYGRAQKNNYPRGEARIRITQERDASMKALEGAKRALAAVE
jgi:hypothetical protein